MSNEPYTPDEFSVRMAWITTGIGSEDDLNAEFDRFVAKVQSDAWEKAVYHLDPFIGSQKRREALADNPYRGTP